MVIGDKEYQVSSFIDLDFSRKIDDNTLVKIMDGVKCSIIKIKIILDEWTAPQKLDFVC